MKKIKEFLIDNCYYIFLVLNAIIIIFSMNATDQVKEKMDYFYILVGVIVIITCLFFTINSIRKTKIIKNNSYRHFGKDNVDKLLLFLDLDLEKEYGKRIANNDDVFNILDFIQNDCEDLLDFESRIDYLESEYKKDIKKIKDIKGIDSFIKRSDEIMNIISMYYDKDGLKK